MNAAAPLCPTRGPASTAEERTREPMMALVR